MSQVNSSIDNCNTPNEVTYKTLSGLMICQFVVGLPLNLSVLYIFLFRFKFWKTKSIFLFNIVVADFLLVACLPAKAYYYQHGLRRSNNHIMCKIMLFMLFLNRGASIAFLTMLSIDRYFNVVHLGRRNFVKIIKKSPQVSVVIWLLLLPLTTPTMVNTFECCHSHSHEYEWPGHNVADTFREIVVFSQIIIPFIILVYCTVRVNRRLKKKTVGDKTKLRRAVCVVTSVVLVFTICFLPCTLARVALLTVRAYAEYNNDSTFKCILRASPKSRYKKNKQITNSFHTGSVEVWFNNGCYQYCCPTGCRGKLCWCSMKKEEKKSPEGNRADKCCMAGGPGCLFVSVFCFSFQVACIWD
ncbi:12-(S)-hydroxy-5,8,10,14-eicosatetraenoic acid receptor-like isoform X1 [Thalassophryne amazonica]|uniref:12-(S)-hydroxy-5,8,10,14-eicosatetraenoic acid receptor-like isoform X1 n=1 Tax=Thalassophryne amazonica TaxID=390379 RepID=UPI001470D523|nr:12-(S)-hydroxy-5,8,10,14-eicosatetraenoic acid receptor-like isoform X1 [Thalassophryne amazonica]